MEIVKNIIGKDCWGIIVDYLAGDKDINKIKYNNTINELNNVFKIFVSHNYGTKDIFIGHLQVRDFLQIYCYDCHYNFKLIDSTPYYKRHEHYYMDNYKIDSIIFTKNLCKKCFLKNHCKECSRSKDEPHATYCSMS